MLKKIRNKNILKTLKDFTNDSERFYLFIESSSNSSLNGCIYLYDNTLRFYSNIILMEFLSSYLYGCVIIPLAWSISSLKGEGPKMSLAIDEEKQLYIFKKDIRLEEIEHLFTEEVYEADNK